jgi:hypothetical protein
VSGPAALSLLAALALALVHVLAHRLRSLRGVPRNRMLSAFGGISVAYVALYLLPEVAGGQQVLDEQLGDTVANAIDRHVYLLLLVGLVLYYGLELAARHSAEANARHAGDREVEPVLFSIALVSFTLYNAGVGYLLPERSTAEGALELLLFTVALGVHFVVNDFALREHHEGLYHDVGRWVLSGAVLLGWALRQVGEVPPLARTALVAFLAGGIILNVFKEELPEDRKSRFPPFLAGAAAYAVLLLLI